MKTQVRETSPQVYARIAGLLYLLVITAGIISQIFISGKIIIAGDAAATAANMASHNLLYQLGFTIYLIEMASQIAMVVLMYLLLKPVNRSIALLALSFGLVGCVIKTLSRLFYLIPLLIIGDAGYASVFGVEQSQALASLLLMVNDRGAGMALAFFGFSTLLNGILIFQSTFLPRILGILSMVGGLGWLCYLYLPLGTALFPYIMTIGIIGSLAQILWLLIKGVAVDQWTRLAAQST